MTGPGAGHRSGGIMRRFPLPRLATLLLVLACQPAFAEEEEGFVSLFDGKSLAGWKVAERPESFSVKDGAIVAHGDRAHAFYVGGKFREFELRMDVMTEPKSNGGVFILSEWQDEGWPKVGYEVQVNNTHGDPIKSGSLYKLVDNKEPFADGEWMRYVIRVEDGRISVSVDDKELVDHKPDAPTAGGAIGLQAHDPGSTVLYKNIRIKTLE